MGFVTAHLAWHRVSKWCTLTTVPPTNSGQRRYRKMSSNTIADSGGGGGLSAGRRSRFQTRREQPCNFKPHTEATSVSPTSCSERPPPVEVPAQQCRRRGLAGSVGIAIPTVANPRAPQDVRASAYLAAQQAIRSPIVVLPPWMRRLWFHKAVSGHWVAYVMGLVQLPMQRLLPNTASQAPSLELSHIAPQLASVSPTKQTPSPARA